LIEEFKSLSNSSVDLDSNNIEFYKNNNNFNKQNEVLVCECTKILIVDDNNFNVFSLQTLIEYTYNIQTDIVT
jgi:hypothetical protein